jgi:hypothetical protein
MKGVLMDFIDLSTLPVRILNPIARRAYGLADLGKMVHAYVNEQYGIASATARETLYSTGFGKITGSGAAGAAVGKFVENLTQGFWEAEMPNVPQK